MIFLSLNSAKLEKVETTSFFFFSEQGMDSELESVFDDDINDTGIKKLILEEGHSSERDALNAQKSNRIDKGIETVNSKENENASLAYSPTHHELDYDSLATYIYPSNFEVRDYQFNIVSKAFFDNLLVALPTGLGKTFIASTVMLNFMRWFPTAKVVFMAPTKPLVAQQIKNCCGTMGISSSQVAILLDKSKSNREEIWNSKKVFFTTPQVVENDLSNGFVDPRLMVLLVIDEAHRARGNYAYNNVVKFLNRFNRSYRILALTATPASDLEGLHEIIDNLSISKVEVRTEQSIDIQKYRKQKHVKRIGVGTSPEIMEAISLLSEATRPILNIANERNICDVTDPLKINAFQIVDASQRLIKNPTIPENLKWLNYFVLQLLNVVGQALRRLNIYGIRSFYCYFLDKFNEFATKYNNKKSTNHTAARFYFHPSTNQLLEFTASLVGNQDFVGHPKLENLLTEVEDFFANKDIEKSRVIIFTEFRESALDIVNLLEKQGDKLKPHIFLGQSKEKERFNEEKYLNRRKSSKNTRKKSADNSELESISRTSSEDAQAKGMNQKFQKELIKKFKEGEYNILVATSIGEEGLDIGEVDLIICYDLTSSPIKNIQRMGRTGRKRDGKVILLFSSNEEQKFDKAMGGYEYIQHQLMKNDVVTLAESNRIIPKKFKPVVELKYIEVPEENTKIKMEEDEDEIIRLATMYMKAKKNKSEFGVKNSKKRDKKFSMPDNVETGFRNVSSMLKDASSVSIDDRKRECNQGLPSSVHYEAADTYQPAVRPIKGTKDMQTENADQGCSDQGLSEAFDNSDSSSNALRYEWLRLEASKKGKTLGVKRRRPKASGGSESSRQQTLDHLVDVTSLERTPKKVHVCRPIEIEKENMEMQDKGSELMPNTIVDSSSDKHGLRVINDVTTKNGNEAKKMNETHAVDDLDDVFDDGLDKQLSLLALRSQSFSEETKPFSSKKMSEDILYTDLVSDEAFLSLDQLRDLYTAHFYKLDDSERVTFYDPSEDPVFHGHLSQYCAESTSHRRFKYGKKSQRFINSILGFSDKSSQKSTDISKCLCSIDLTEIVAKD